MLCLTRWSLLVWLHGGEEQNFLDVIGVGQQHGEAIDTHAPSSSRWKTILESANVILIDTHRLIVSITLSSRLLLEEFKLNFRVI